MAKAMVGMTVAAVALIGVATVIVWRQLAIEDVIVAQWQQREDAMTWPPNCAIRPTT